MKTSKERRPRLLILAVLGAVTLIMLAWMANTIWHRDARRFQGVWSGEGYRLTVHGEIATLESPSFPTPSAAYFHLDPRAKPARIQFWPSETRNLQSRTTFLGVSFGSPRPLLANSESHGIYEIDDNQLRILLSEPGGEYPTGFEPRDGYLSLNLRRE